MLHRRCSSPELRRNLGRPYNMRLALMLVGVVAVLVLHPLTPHPGRRLALPIILLPPRAVRSQVVEAAAAAHATARSRRNCSRGHHTIPPVQPIAPTAVACYTYRCRSPDGSLALAASASACTATRTAIAGHSSLVTRSLGAAHAYAWMCCLCFLAPLAALHASKLLRPADDRAPVRLHMLRGGVMVGRWRTGGGGGRGGARAGGEGCARLVGCACRVVVVLMRVCTWWGGLPAW